MGKTCPAPLKKTWFSPACIAVRTRASSTSVSFLGPRHDLQFGTCSRARFFSNQDKGVNTIFFCCTFPSLNTIFAEARASTNAFLVVRQCFRAPKIDQVEFTVTNTLLQCLAQTPMSQWMVQLGQTHLIILSLSVVGKCNAFVHKLQLTMPLFFRYCGLWLSFPRVHSQILQCTAVGIKHLCFKLPALFFYSKSAMQKWEKTPIVKTWCF